MNTSIVTLSKEFEPRHLLELKPSCRKKCLGTCESYKRCQVVLNVIFYTLTFAMLFKVFECWINKLSYLAGSNQAKLL